MKIKKTLALIMIVAGAISLGLYFKDKNKTKTYVFNEPLTEDQQPSHDQESETPGQTETPPTQEKAPESKENTDLSDYDRLIINVPFAVQAPGGNWDALHEDACEEASLIMVNRYMTKKSIGNSQEIEPELQSMIKYEEGIGLGKSISLQQLNDVAKNYFSMTTGRIVTNVSVDSIKAEIRKGHPVIIPAAGKLLDNPNFRNGGPNYHMLVIKGYDQKNFITNDPGTRKGEGFVYTYDNLINAIHDWDEANILNGRKAYLVFD